MERRLAAILAADVVGYSRMIRADEEGTLVALRALREELIDPVLTVHHGRIVKLMGDGMLVEFASAVDAVRAAVETQQAVADHNSGLPEDKRIEFRVGINLGDVVIDGDDIHGDSVNVAARLESLSEAGGICISDKVYEEVRDRTDFTFEDLGEQEVKNIDRPVQVWRWLPAGLVAATDAASPEQPLSLPDKPSIAVLPFTNMSDDPEQEYFSDGITEDIITELSRYSELFVIARNSTFAYKGPAFNTDQVARELGVRHVLEGSVRRAGNRVRVTAQLIDTNSGDHIWAERYDRELEDIFAVQDEITAVIVNTLLGKLTHREYERALHKRPEALGAYDHALRAMVLFHKLNPSDNDQARREAEMAVQIDPNFARAYALIAWTFTGAAVLRWVDDPASSFQRGHESAEKAVALDDEEPWAHAALGFSEVWGNRAYERGIQALKRAVALNPNNAHFRGWLSNALCMSGRSEEAYSEIETAMRLNPHYPPIYLHFLARILVTQRRYGDALPHLERLTTAMPENTNALALTAACYAGLERPEEAMAVVKKILAVSPSFLLSAVPNATPYARSEDMDHYVGLLRQAGLPEE